MGAPPREAELPRKLTARYQLETLLGQGGMGKVYRARDLLEGREVAVKLVRPEEGDNLTASERFLREAKVTARLTHPNVVQVFDVGLSEQRELFLVMELLLGESLSSRLHRLIRLTPGDAVAIGTQVCAGLQASHQQGIIHRDLKPANLMLVDRPPGPPRVKVLDFGIAKALGPETRLTATGTMVGTMEYMAPEQILGQPIDGRADMYALGAVLYKMLTGTSVFPDTSPATLMHHHLNVAPEPVRARAPEADIPPALERVLQRCLSKSPDQRFRDMAQVAEALQAALHNEMVPAAAQDLRPRALSSALAVETLELDSTGAVDDVPFRRCAVCHSDSSRFATSCARCGADLTTPEQLAYLRQVLAERAEQVEPTEVKPEPPVPGAAAAVAPPAPTTSLRRPLPPASSAVQAAPSLPTWLEVPFGVLESFPKTIWKRVALYAAVAAAIGWGFGLVGSRGAVGLLLLSGLGAAGFWNSKVP